MLTDGFINVLKPPGMSSGAVAAMVRRVSGMKVGHAGTLDPEACGILPIMTGRAARLFDLLVEKEKTYLAEIAFGSATDTQDAQGKVIARGDRFPSLQQLTEALPHFTGDIQQIPPMYSALKLHGETLYKMALKGEKADVPPRTVRVYSLEMIAGTSRNGALLRIVCGRGTYIRTLCHDIGIYLGCPAHMRFLERTQSGVFTLDTAFTVEQIKADWKACLLPPDYPLGHLTRWDVPSGLQAKCINGVSLRPGEWPGAPQGEMLRLYASGQLIGIFYGDGEGVLRPRCVLYSAQKEPIR